MGCIQEKPIHSDINKYDYFLQYSPAKKSWFASYNTDKGTAWYIWTGSAFKLLLSYNEVPKDLILI